MSRLAQVDWSAGRVGLLTRGSVRGRRREAGRVGPGCRRSGLAGTNAHVILEEAPDAMSRQGVGRLRRAGDGAGWGRRR